ELLIEEIRLKSHGDRKIFGLSIFASTHHATTSTRTQNRPYSKLVLDECAYCKHPSLIQHFQKFLAFQPQALATSSGNGLSSSGIVFTKWILDSGASDDSIFTPSASLFDVYYRPRLTMNLVYVG
ncbi:hypothetical protein Tco_0881027, partial [Tanacetum coccineum]